MMTCDSDECCPACHEDWEEYGYEMLWRNGRMVCCKEAHRIDEQEANDEDLEG